MPSNNGRRLSSRSFTSVPGLIGIVTLFQGRPSRIPKRFLPHVFLLNVAVNSDMRHICSPLRTQICVSVCAPEIHIIINRRRNHGALLRVYLRFVQCDKGVTQTFLHNRVCNSHDEHGAIRAPGQALRCGA